MLSEGRENGLLKIGDFAAASGLTIKMLHNYHASGLLDPCLIDHSTGYRYYRAEQLREATAIRRLRDADVPLDLIRQVITSGPRVARVLLEAHRAEFRQRFLEVDRQLASVLEHLQMEGRIMTANVQETELPPTRVGLIHLEDDHPIVGLRQTRAFIDLQIALQHRDALKGQRPILLIHPSTEDAQIVDVCYTVPEGIAELEGAHVTELAGVRAATAETDDPTFLTEEPGNVLYEVIDWIQQKGYTPATPLRLYPAGLTPTGRAVVAVPFS